MHFSGTRSGTRLVAFFLALATLLVSGVAAADAPSAPHDWTLTGSGTRVKTVALIDFEVYDVSHYVKGTIAEKTKQSAIDADLSKKLVWRMRRDVEREKIAQALRSGFALNGYTNTGKIALFVAAFRADLKEGQRVTIAYDTERKDTTLSVEGGGVVTIAGLDFMKAVWSIWFGHIDQPALGNQLLSKMR